MTFLVFLKKFMHEYKKKLAKRKEKDLRDRRRLSNFFTSPWLIDFVGRMRNMAYNHSEEKRIAHMMVSHNSQKLTTL